MIRHSHRAHLMAVAGAAVASLLILPISLFAAAPDRETAEASLRMGNGLFDQDHFAESADAYTQALAADPSFIEAYYNRAVANEMVDRPKALADWRRFIDLAGDKPDLKWRVGSALARLQILGALPGYPEGLKPSHYATAAGDYYFQIADVSETEKWMKFPVKVFLGSTPNLNWQQGAREAFDIWSGLIPLELVVLPQLADIRMDWAGDTDAAWEAGEELDWVQIRRSGGELTGRRIASIRVDLSRPWNKNEMRAINPA